MKPFPLGLTLLVSVTVMRSPSSSRGADDASAAEKEIVSKLKGGLSALDSALERYNKIESSGRFDIFARHTIHLALVAELRSIKDPGFLKKSEQVLARTAKTAFPGQVALLKTAVGADFPASTTERLDLLLRAAKGKDAKLSTWGIRLLAETRWPEAIEALIAMLAEEERAGRYDGVTGELISSELFRVLGADAVRGGSGRIREAWERMKRKAPSEPSRNLPADAGVTGTFFGARISPHSLFLIDASSSMLEPVASAGWKPGRTAVGKGDGRPKGWPEPKQAVLKIDEAKKELQQVLKSLRTSYQFNILSYNSTFHPWKGGVEIKLVPASASALESASGFVKDLKTDHRTNIHDTIAAALEVPGVDTIYLLSDGVPTSGGSPEEIEARVAALNYLRCVRVLTFGFTSDKPGDFDEDFMKRLAASNWGWYKRLND